MAKKIDGYIKLQIPTGKATPAPRRTNTWSTWCKYSSIHKRI